MRLYRREQYLERLSAFDQEPHLDDMVRVITGVRRCGKSTVLELYRRDLEASGTRVITVNFEDLALERLRQPQEFVSFVETELEQLGDGPVHLHVDEVQELEDWARVINSLRLRSELTITVTGSNASMFAGEGLTYLAGRYVQMDMLPLSLEEFRGLKGYGPQVSAEESYSQWMNGTLPAVAGTTDEFVRDTINNAVFDSIFTRDIALRGSVQDPEVFIRVARFLFDGAGSPISVNRIANSLSSAGMKTSNHTVEKYLRLMVEAHMFYACGRVDVRGREHLRNSKKYYFVDPGLRNAILGKTASNLGHDLENMVYLELLRRGYRVDYGQSSAGEIDFVARDGESALYVQVALSTLEPATLERELSSFAPVPAGAACLLLTLDRLDPGTGDVQWMNAAEFLAGRQALGTGPSAWR